MLTETEVKEYLAFFEINWDGFSLWHRTQTKTIKEGITYYPSEDVRSYITAFIRRRYI